MKCNSYPLQDLPGLDATNENQLAALGISTTEQLYRQGRLPEQRQSLARTLNVPLRYVVKWVVLAELSRVPSVGCQFCGVLLHSGISSVEQLAASSPQLLYRQVRRLNVTAMNRSDLCPTPDQINNWIHNARKIVRHPAG
jgi:hypothetical protein